jgi:hypothetical protein
MGGWIWNCGGKGEQRKEIAIHTDSAMLLNATKGRSFGTPEQALAIIDTVPNRDMRVTGSEVFVFKRIAVVLGFQYSTHNSFAANPWRTAVNGDPIFIHTSGQWLVKWKHQL